MAKSGQYCKRIQVIALFILFLLLYDHDYIFPERPMRTFPSVLLHLQVISFLITQWHSHPPLQQNKKIKNGSCKLSISSSTYSQAVQCPNELLKSICYVYFQDTDTYVWSYGHIWGLALAVRTNEVGFHMQPERKNVA